MKLFKNNHELQVVASIIFAEIQITHDQTNNLINALSVLNVGINRLNKPKYFKCTSLYEVFTKPKQFSCYPDSKQFKKAMEGELSIKEGELFRYIRQMIEVLNNCDTSNHYYNPKLCNPSWAKDKTVDYVIGGHNFLTLP